MSADKLNSIIGDPVKRAALAKRFWSKVDRRGPDECWPWTAKAKHKHGYGMLTVFTGHVDYSHRLAFILTHGRIEDGAVIRHSCDNPPCCNPKHLLNGTHLDNVQDMMERGRHRPPVFTQEIKDKIAATRRANPQVQTERQREAARQVMTDRWQDPEWRERFRQQTSGENHPLYGTGPVRTPEITAKIVASRKAAGYRHSEETKAKMKAAALGRPSPTKGRKHSAEARASMKAAALAREAAKRHQKDRS